MNATLMKGTIRNGRVETNRAIELPDGTEVSSSVSKNGMTDVEEGWDNGPTAISAWLTWCDSLQPMTITPDERAETDAWVKKSCKYEASK